ncbi:hypothetical protein DICVIV_13138 [Dictyocaulus viviparus]|uniref:Uncharacterized protein n=1 Tax=Dictyocaulus viviparus TaxID=29172 RepID=A0A0D8X8M5_DICVI|nr:hypothetical protein DICVIV_13138 [Dictyocaulus viviparus]
MIMISFMHVDSMILKGDSKSTSEEPPATSTSSSVPSEGASRPETESQTPKTCDEVRTPSIVCTSLPMKDGPHRYRFVIPMVVLADINGRIYRLTTHYTVTTDRPKLEFKPLSIKFDGQLLWEKSPDLSQVIEAATSCSTGQGTFTEHSPISTYKNT